MTTVKEIEMAIADLPAHKFAVLRTWFEEFDASLWDKQLEVDVKSGKLNALASKALANHKKGKCKEL
jgi:hypothetical protein